MNITDSVNTVTGVSKLGLGKRAFTVSLVVILLFSILTGCTVLSGNHASKACELATANPHVSSGEQKKGKPPSIVGKAKATCDISPESHLVWMTLELQVKGKWIQQAASDRDKRLPNPGEVIAYQVNYDGCIPGMWKVTAIVKGALQGKNFTFTDSTTAEVASSRCEQ